MDDLHAPRSISLARRAKALAIGAALSPGSSWRRFAFAAFFASMFGGFWAAVAWLRGDNVWWAALYGSLIVVLPFAIGFDYGPDGRSAPRRVCVAALVGARERGLAWMAEAGAPPMPFGIHPAAARAFGLDRGQPLDVLSSLYGSMGARQRLTLLARGWARSPRVVDPIAAVIVIFGLWSALFVFWALGAVEHGDFPLGKTVGVTFLALFLYRARRAPALMARCGTPLACFRAWRAWLAVLALPDAAQVAAAESASLRAATDAGLAAATPPRRRPSRL